MNLEFYIEQHPFHDTDAFCDALGDLLKSADLLQDVKKEDYLFLWNGRTTASASACRFWQVGATGPWRSMS